MYQTTRRHILEESNLYSHGHANLKFLIVVVPAATLTPLDRFLHETYFEK
jgi:hypothetical protein